LPVLFAWLFQEEEHPSMETEYEVAEATTIDGGKWSKRFDVIVVPLSLFQGVVRPFPSANFRTNSAKEGLDGT
jgi:hypothetical protein